MEFFPEHIKKALQNEPPGAWMPMLPKNCFRLSSGYPDPTFVPAQELKKAVAKLIDEENDLPLHYIGSPRIDGLKRHILNRMAERKMNLAESEMLITSGASQAIDLIARLLLDEKATVIVEAPTYMEALEIFQNYTKKIISIPIDEEGLQTEFLKGVLSERAKNGDSMPSFLYTIPSYQNPTGTTLTKERRKQLIRLADKYDFLILEDDAYGELSFEKPPTPLKAMDLVGRVIHIGSLSKVVAPGMRIGWIAAKSELISAIAWFKKDLDHPFAQSSMAAFLESVDYDARLKALRNGYEAKCATMLRSINQFFPGQTSLFVPNGGYFVWVKIPGLDTAKLLPLSLAEGVSFIPGKYFFHEQSIGTEYLRLSFSYASEKEIIEGIKILGQLIHRFEKL